MKTFFDKISHWRQSPILLIAALLIAACGGNEATPTPEPPPTVAPTATTAAATETPAETPTDAPQTPVSDTPAQNQSPLAQPESPLAQPQSPLAVVNRPLTDEEAVALAANTAPPPATAGNGSLSAVVYSVGRSKGGVPGTQFYLVKPVEIEGNLVPPPLFVGPDDANDDVYGFTTMEGQIQLGDVPPGDYYLAVWTLYDWLLGYAAGSGEGSPRMFTIKEGDEQNLGVFYVNWP